MEQVARTPVFAVCGSSSCACGQSNSRFWIGRHSHAVDGQTTAAFLLIRADARIFVHATPPPILGRTNEPGDGRFHVNILQEEDRVILYWTNSSLVTPNRGRVPFPRLACPPFAAQPICPFEFSRIRPAGNGTYTVSQRPPS